MISPVSAFALLSLVLAAPAVVEPSFGLVATLSNDANIDGFAVFSKDDGSLWLRNNNGDTIQMLAKMDLSGNVRPNAEGTSLAVNDDGSVTLSNESTSDFVIDEESVLSTGDGLIAMSGCPADAGLQLFAGAADCEGRVDFALRAVTDVSMPITENSKSLDVKQNFCCPLKACFKCGGCKSHGSCGCEHGSGSGSGCGCSGHNGAHRPTCSEYPAPFVPAPAPYYPGAPVAPAPWVAPPAPWAPAPWVPGPAPTPCGGVHLSPAAPVEPQQTTIDTPCHTCDPNGTGPVVIGTHNAATTAAAPTTAPHFHNGTAPAHTQTVTQAGPTVTEVVYPAWTQPAVAPGAGAPSPFVPGQVAPVPYVPAPAACGGCGATTSAECTCGGHYGSGNVFAPGTNFGHSQNGCGKCGSGHKPCLCDLKHALPCPKNILCGLCHAKPCACASSHTSECSKCNSNPCACESSNHSECSKCNFKRCVCPKDILCNICNSSSCSGNCAGPRAPCTCSGPCTGACSGPTYTWGSGSNSGSGSWGSGSGSGYYPAPGYYPGSGNGNGWYTGSGSGSDCSGSGSSSGSGSGNGNSGSGSTGTPIIVPAPVVPAPAPITVPAPVAPAPVIVPAPVAPAPGPIIVGSGSGSGSVGCGRVGGAYPVPAPGPAPYYVVPGSYASGAPCNTCNGPSPCECIAGKLKALKNLCPGKLLCGGCNQCCK